MNISSNRSHHAAFTLVELLVVIAVISILIGLTVPAVQSVRRSAQNLSCKNNLRNIGIAVLNHEATLGHLPMAYQIPQGTVVPSYWSIHAQIMPYMEETNAYRRIDLDIDWHNQVATGVPAHAVPVYNCPAEINRETRQKSGEPYVHGTNYGFNMGTWFIYDPVTGATGDGAFQVNRKMRDSDFLDGRSTTLCATEVKAYTPYVRNVDTVDPTFPTDPDFFEGVSGELKLGPSPGLSTGHTVWCDARVHHTGFTTTFAPNTTVNYTLDGELYDIDYSSQQEGKDLTRATYAAVTARSFHSAGVNGLNLDGSVHQYSNSINLNVWRDLGTIRGREIVNTDYLN